MLIDKRFDTVQSAVADIPDGATVLIGGFGNVGVPFELIYAVVEARRRNLTLVANNCGTGEDGIARLFKYGLVRRIVASFPAQAGNYHFRHAYDAGEVEVELVPQGTLAERLHAGAGGLGGFFTPTGVGTDVALGKEVRSFDGHDYVFEQRLRGDVALVHAHLGDARGNLRFRRSARNFNSVMAMAADLTIAEVEKVVPTGDIDPDDVHTPGVFVDRVVQVGQ